MRRTCKNCGHDGPLNEFPPQKGGKHGRRPVCRPCFNKLRKLTRNYKPRKAKPQQSRQYYLKRTYGLQAGEYDSMLVAQNGVCAICRGKPEANTKYARLAVDHCHATGRVRALLCFNCNAGLGNLKDNAALLRAAAEYVERHS